MSSAATRLLQACYDRPDLFFKHVLGASHPSIPGGLTSKQLEILQGLETHRRVASPSGHGVGKSLVAALAALCFLYTRPNSIVICVSPSATQLQTVLWQEIKKLHNNSRIKLPGRIINGSNPRIEVADKWYLAARSADSDPERLAGTHAEHIRCILDEASWEGYDEVIETLDGINASSYLLTGNPLRKGKFHEICQRPETKVVSISSLDSPHAHLERSPVGLADKGYLDDMRASYGEDSPQWRVRVLGQFPDEDDWSLIPSDWIDLCDFPHPGKKGPTRISVDLSKGVGGTSDNSVVMVWDDAGILDLKWANTWSLEATARLVVTLADDFDVHPSKVTYDGTGLGLGFGNQLDALGFRGSQAYVGTSQLRSASAWRMRERLDPRKKIIPTADPRLKPVSSLNHLFGVMATPAPKVEDPYNQAPFSIRKDWLARLRPELLAFRYKLAHSGGIVLESKEELKKRLGHSCDFADALLIGCSNS